MTSPTFIKKLLGWTAFGGLLGIGLGCVLTVGGGGTDECDCIACNSHLETNADGVEECVCDQGYDWAHPEDPNNYDCDLNNDPKPGTSNCVEDYHVQIGDQCACIDGFAFCNDDPADLTCCMVGETGGNTGGPADTGTPTSDGSGDTTVGVDDTGGDVCDNSPAPNNGVMPPAEACDMAAIGSLFCSNTEEEGPAGSIYYECTESGWVDATATTANDTCQFDNFDFAVGCIDNGVDVEVVCGLGPGTDCSGPECDACADDDLLNYCDNAKLQAVSCLVQCTDIGIEGVTFEHGYCTVDASDGLPTCACCDSGDKGCPI